MLLALLIATTIVLQHIIIGTCLYLFISFLTTFVVKSAEMRSWLWYSTLITVTVAPLVLMKKSTAQIERNSPTQVVQIIDKDAVLRDDATFMTASMITSLLLPENEKAKTSIYSPLTLTYKAITPYKGPLYGVFAIIIMGILWRIQQFIYAIQATRKLRLSCKDLVQRPWFSQYGNFTVLTSDAVGTPLVIGFIKPVIVIPRACISRLKDRQLAPIILHELAHIRRYDLFAGLIQELINIVFWWSPIVIGLNKKVHISREVACDMRASRQLENHKQYAQSLIDNAKFLLNHNQEGLTMHFLNKQSSLSYRIDEVLRQKSSKIPHTISIIMACIALTSATYVVAKNYTPAIYLDEVSQQTELHPAISRTEGARIIEAISKLDFDLIDQLVADGLNINRPITGDGTPLIIAVRQGNIDMIAHLISLGADVNKAALQDGNPMITAALTNNTSTAAYLLQQGATIDSIVQGDETPLISASRHGHYDMVAFLVSHGANVNLGVEVKTRNGDKIFRSPLNTAKNKKIRDYLKSMGANV